MICVFYLYIQSKPCPVCREAAVGPGGDDRGQQVTDQVPCEYEGIIHDHLQSPVTLTCIQLSLWFLVTLSFYCTIGGNTCLNHFDFS